MSTDPAAPDRPHAPVEGLAAAPVRPPARWRCAGLLLATLVAGCAPRTGPATFAVPTATAVRIRMACPPDTFIGTMTVDCPQPLPRAAPAR